MKIAFILPNISSGGAERVVSILSASLVEKGYDVDIVLLYDGKIQYEIDQRVKIVNLMTAGESKVKRILTLRKYIKNERSHTEIILVPFQDSCLKNAAMARVFLKVPLIACERNNPYRKGKSLIRKIKAAIPFVLANHCVFQTEDARNYYHIVPDKKCSVIINPIQTPKYSWSGNTDASKMIMVCRLHRQKNIKMLIDAIALARLDIPEVCVHIYGEGDLLDELKIYAKEKAVENAVIFEGRTDDIQSKLSMSSIFLLTSDFEGISNAMLEAMSVGMPLICTDCPIGGARLMLADGAGILSPVGDARAFADNIIALLRDTEKMYSIAKAAKQKANEFSVEFIVNQWETLFKSLLRQGRKENEPS